MFGSAPIEGRRFPGAVEASYPDDVVELQGQLANSYASAAEITDAASAVAVVRIEDGHSESYKGLPFTTSRATVIEAIKGDIEPDETLTIVEMGGVHRGRSKDEPGEYGDPREAAPAGVPVMKPGEVYLVFLQGPTHVGPEEQGAYGIQGAFQGKVRVSPEGRLQFTGPSEAVGSPMFAVPSELAGRDIDSAIADIEAAVE